TNDRPVHSATSSRRSRVTPGRSSTIAARVPTMRLTSDDLPTLGRPTTATRGSPAVIAMRLRPPALQRACGVDSPPGPPVCAWLRDRAHEGRAVGGDDLDRAREHGNGLAVEEATP